jgi:hypothetical protein
VTLRSTALATLDRSLPHLRTLLLRTLLQRTPLLRTLLGTLLLLRTPHLRTLPLVALASLAVLLGSGPARARPKPKAKTPAAAQDPSRWFATRAGLLRVYQERQKQGGQRPADDAPPVGASCEVVESTPKEDGAPARTKERCTMITGRKAKAPTALSYELRPAGVYLVRAETQGQKPAELDRLLLPKVAKGKAWSEQRGPVQIVRTVKSAGTSCKAAGRSFGDCLVLSVEERDGRKVRRRYPEVYAAGVGLVEDAQWELIDVKGL